MQNDLMNDYIVVNLVIALCLCKTYTILDVLWCRGVIVESTICQNGIFFQFLSSSRDFQTRHSRLAREHILNTNLYNTITSNSLVLKLATEVGQHETIIFQE